MFFPQLFGIVGEKLVCTKDREYDDPEDLYDDRYLLEVRICVLILEVRICVLMLFYGHFVTTHTPIIESQSILPLVLPTSYSLLRLHYLDLMMPKITRNRARLLAKKTKFLMVYTTSISSQAYESVSCKR